MVGNTFNMEAAYRCRVEISVAGQYLLLLALIPSLPLQVNEGSLFISSLRVSVYIPQASSRTESVCQRPDKGSVITVRFEWDIRNKIVKL